MSAERPDLARPAPNGPDAVEIVTIGDELLLGHTIDTNAAFLSRELVGAGFRVTRRTTVGDDEPAIAEAVNAALDRARFVICTGGLGSTRDDFTRPVVAKLFDAPLEVDQRLLDALKERFKVRGIAMTSNNLSQAEVPRGATVLPNRRGTAQGLVLCRPDDHCCILLPGVPHELRGLTVEQVLPYLLGKGRGMGRERHAIRYRVVRTTGIAESAVAERLESVLAQIEPLTVAFLPNFAGTDLRITSWGELDDAKVDSALESAEQLIREAVDSHIYGTGSVDLAAVIGELLRERGLRLSVAESCTGGLLAKRITDIAGSSDYFHGGVVAYANDAKLDLLGVSADTLKEHGAVSEAAVREMVRGALRLDECEAAMAITGVAGPGGGTVEKPVGTVWIAAAIRDDVQTRKITFTGDREEIRERSAQAALTLMWKLLKPLPLPMPIAHAPVTSSDGYLEGVGGLRLYYRAWEQARARAAILIIHGLGEHGGRYESIAHQLTSYGFSVYALDLRGHGLSDGRRGHVPRFEFFLQDVDRFRREVQGFVDVGCPLFLLGHSMGGLIALRYLEEFDAPLAGGIIISPWLATAMSTPRWKVTLVSALNKVLPAVPFDSGLNPKHLSRDAAVVSAYEDDPAVHSRITPRLFAEASIAMGLALQRSDRIDVPLLFLLAGDDRIVDRQRSEAFARSLSVRSVTVHVYAGFYHEVLNEPERVQPLHDIRIWISQRLTPGQPTDQILTAEHAETAE